MIISIIHLEQFFIHVSYCKLHNHTIETLGEKKRKEKKGIYSPICGFSSNFLLMCIIQK